MEPTRCSLDRAVEKSMGMFNRAKIGTVLATEVKRPQSVLLALDGSTQDAFGIAIARQLRKQYDCQLVVVDGRVSETKDALLDTVAQQLETQVQRPPLDDSFQQILSAVESSQCDLLISPCPYGRDLELIGPDSTGTVIDVLLARSPVPVLVVRQPCEPEGDLFQRVEMVLTAENEAAEHAARWAVGMIAPEGEFQLVLVMEREMYENVAALMQSIAPDMELSADSLSHALARNYMRLHRGLQKAASEMGFSYKLRLEVEGETTPLPAAANTAHPTLRVLALERSDRVSEGTVQARIRKSAQPVLVVFPA